MQVFVDLNLSGHQFVLKMQVPTVDITHIGTYQCFFVDLVLSDHYSGVKELGTYS